MAATIKEKVNPSLKTDRVPEDIWMIRPCEFYREEHLDCKSLAGRFNQYYVFGALEDCKQWKHDLQNCLKFAEKNTPEAAERIVEHERERMQSRLAGARGNDVWEYRTTPPPEWNAPMETWLREKENTILGRVARAGVTSPQTDTANSPCAGVTSPPTDTANSPRAGVTSPPTDTANSPRAGVTSPQTDTANSPRVGVTSPPTDTANSPRVGVTSPPTDTANSPRARVTSPPTDTANSPCVIL